MFKRINASIFLNNPIASIKMNNLIEKQKGEQDNLKADNSSKKIKNSSLSPSDKKKGIETEKKLKGGTSDYNSVQNTINISKKKTLNVDLKTSKNITLNL